MVSVKMKKIGPARQAQFRKIGAQQHHKFFRNLIWLVNTLHLA